ncbi:hypothetical protein ACNO5E_25235, partial [Vibrio parahaemolyticus]
MTETITNAELLVFPISDDIKSEKVREAYRVLKQMRHLGEKVTKNKVATEAKFSPSNLTPSKKTGCYKTSEWEELVNMINKVINESEPPSVEDAKNRLRATRDEWKSKYETLVDKTAQGINLQVDFKRRLNDAEEMLERVRSSRDQLVLDYEKAISDYQRLKQMIDKARAEGDEKLQFANFGKSVIST